MSNPPKARGTLAETAVERYINARVGAGAAQRVALKGNSDQGDIHIRGGAIVLEVKSRRKWASPAQIEAWLAETEREATRVPQCSIGALVVKRPGSGVANAGDWLVYLRLDELALLAWGADRIHTDIAHEWACINLAAFASLLRTLPAGAL